MRRFEVPLIVEVDAEDRPAADQRAEDLADAVSSVFNVSASAVITQDHNILERLRIDYNGKEVPDGC